MYMWLCKKNCPHLILSIGHGGWWRLGFSFFNIPQRANHNVSLYEWLLHGVRLALENSLLFGNIMNRAKVNIDLSKLKEICPWGPRQKRINNNNDRQQHCVQTINLKLILNAENGHLPSPIKAWEDPDVIVCSVSSLLNRQFTFVLHAARSIQLRWDNSGFVWANQCCLSEERERIKFHLLKQKQQKTAVQIECRVTQIWLTLCMRKEMYFIEMWIFDMWRLMCGWIGWRVPRVWWSNFLGLFTALQLEMVKYFFLIDRLWLRVSIISKISKYYLHKENICKLFAGKKRKENICKMLLLWFKRHD